MSQVCSERLLTSHRSRTELSEAVRDPLFQVYSITGSDPFLRGTYPNGWRAEREIRVTTLTATGQKTLELGRTNIPDPPRGGCTP